VGRTAGEEKEESKETTGFVTGDRAKHSTTNLGNEVLFFATTEQDIRDNFDNMLKWLFNGVQYEKY